jgi:hypothetical protein
VLCFRHDDDDDDHGVRRANMARALAQWRRLGASHEATNTLHPVMCLAPYLSAWSSQSPSNLLHFIFS